MSLLCSAFVVNNRGFLLKDCFASLCCFVCSLQASWTRPEQHKVEIPYPWLHKLNYEDSHQLHKPPLSYPIKSLKSHQIINWIMMSSLFHLRVKWCSSSFHFLFSACCFFILSNQLSHYDIVLLHYAIIRLHSQGFIFKKNKTKKTL